MTTHRTNYTHIACSHQAYFNRGNAYAELGQYERAIADFDRALEIDPSSPLQWSCWCAKGVALANLGRPSEGIQWVNKAVEAFPNSPKFLVAKGWTLTELGRHQAALEYYNKSLEVKPTGLAWSGKGLLLDRMGATPMEVLFCYEKALEIGPKHPPIWSKK
ncbi:MAG: tetratricopeptide repeat protein [Planctomycetota bacterium]